MAYSRESKQGTGSFRKKLRKMVRKGKASQAAYLREKRRKEMGYSSWGIDNPRKVKGRSTTLKNMASVTIQKLPNGVVKITGRKMAGNPAPRLPKHATFKVVKTYGGYIITKNGRKVDGPWNLWEARSRAKRLKEQNRRDVDMFGQW